MGYEIPQQLQYEEKIIFGLTFKQLMYAFIFILPALLIFLKTSLNIYVKATIASVLIGLGCMFMFFNLSSQIKNFIAWFRYREFFLMDECMIQFIGIEKIDEGVVYVWKTKKPCHKK